MIDDFRKGWALRYIREAEDEMKAAQRAAKPFYLILDAARKAQAAVYFSLGDPLYIEGLVQEACEDGKNVENPILRCLVNIEDTLKRMESLSDSADEEAFNDAAEIIKIASGIVKLLAIED
ncbi:hypothetical protein KEJ18_05510 [Candidatus Bathyarchaeota archaeon]|nr:hypothetical protein [Candidatus Bathyarchaeota archaeon]